MDYKNWLCQQLEVTYGKSNISRDGDFINMVDVPYNGIIIKQNEGLHVSFKGFDLVEFSALSVYLEPRIKKDGLRVYIKQSDKTIWYYIDNKFSAGSRGEFEKGMYVFTIIQNLVSNINSVVERVIEA